MNKMLTAEEWGKIFEDAIKTPEDQANLLSALNKARDEYVTGIAELTAANDKAKSLEDEVGRLRQTNMELFLRIGQQVNASTGEDVKDDNGERDEKITIDDVLKEELKHGN